MKTLKNFTATQVENGWIVSVHSPMGPAYSGIQYVFASLAELGAWLAAESERLTAEVN